MSHDIKYIGMDVHKEATVIAVLISEMAIISTVDFLRINFHSVGANFYITLIGAAVLLAMFYLHYQRRAATMRAVARRLGFEYKAETLPPSLNLRGTGLNSATSTWNVIEGKRHGVRVVAFDCRLGTGKGNWRRSVIAAEGSADVFGMFNPEFAVEYSEGWVLLYQPKAVSLIPPGLMPVTEIEARLNAIT
jgi:hypothetical protein